MTVDDKTITRKTFIAKYKQHAIFVQDRENNEGDNNNLTETYKTNI